MEDKLSEEIHILYQAGNNEEVVKQGLLLHERLKKNARFMLYVFVIVLHNHMGCAS